MQEDKRFKHNLSQFGRALSLLMNRATMYQADHPYFRDSLDAFFTVAEDLTLKISPLVFILTQERFFIDEEPLDSRINVARMVNHFKKAEIQSISFYKGINKNELRAFMEVFTSLHKYPNADAMSKVLEQRGVRHIRINHVFYRKVTSDDEVVGRDALKQMTPELSAEAERQSKKMFFDALLENVLSEELEKTLSVRNLMTNPSGVSKTMIDNDLAVARQSGGGIGEGGGPGGDGAGAVPDAAPASSEGGAPASATGPSGPEPAQAAQAGPTGAGAAAASTGGPAPASATGPSGPEPAQAAQAGLTGAGVATASTGGPAPASAAGPSGPAEPAQAAQAGPTAAGVATASTGGAAQGAGTSAASPSGMPGGAYEEGETPAGSGRPGPVLAHQLHLIDEEIEKSLRGEGDVDLQELAMAVFQMKTELVGGIESQKALGIAYENEQDILEKANELTDKVFVKLVRDEYRAGNVTTGRLAQIIRRLIPDADELKRLLPKIKTALIQEGMPLPEYLKLIKELGRELQDEGLARILQESSEEVGVDGEELIEEIKKNPKQAAELMAIAAEVRKGTGDEEALTDVLVEYVERLGTDMSQEMAGRDEAGNEDHLRNVITGVESKLVRQLRDMDLQEDVLVRIEDKLNSRLDSIVEDIKMDWIRSTALRSGSEGAEELTVLQTLERSVSEGGELGELLKAVRVRVEANEINEDDFAQIYQEIERLKQEQIEAERNRKMPDGVLNTENILLFIKKEISKAVRYELPFSALAFTVVRAKYREQAPPGKKIPAQELLDRVLERLAVTVRDTDVVGKLKKNQMVALLPMTPARDAKLALKRTMKKIHSDPFDLMGAQLDVTLAGTATTYQKARTPDEAAFLEALSSDLVDMATRVKNIHALM